MLKHFITGSISSSKSVRYFRILRCYKIEIISWKKKKVWDIVWVVKQFTLSSRLQDQTNFMGWTCASFGRFSGSFASRVDHSWCCWHVRWSVTHLRDRSSKKSGDPHNVKTFKTSSWGGVRVTFSNIPPNSLWSWQELLFWSQLARRPEWVSEWVGLAGWAACHHQSGLPACSLPACPCLPYLESSPHNPWRHLEMRSWSREEERITIWDGVWGKQ